MERKEAHTSLNQLEFGKETLGSTSTRRGAPCEVEEVAQERTLTSGKLKKGTGNSSAAARFGLHDHLKANSLKW